MSVSGSGLDDRPLPGNRLPQSEGVGALATKPLLTDPPALVCVETGSPPAAKTAPGAQSSSGSFLSGTACKRLLLLSRARGIARHPASLRTENRSPYARSGQARCVRTRTHRTGARPSALADVPVESSPAPEQPAPVPLGCRPSSPLARPSLVRVGAVSWAWRVSGAEPRTSPTVQVGSSARNSW